jgi:hypothetical protein
MATTIKLKNSVTTTNAPSSLAQGEVAINVTDKKVWVGNAATTPVQLLGDGGSASFTTVAFGDGSAASPSITNIGDTNTGIFFPAADIVAFSEGGVESMRIDSLGNMGIGTSSPGARVDAYTSSTTSTVLRARNDSVTVYLDANNGYSYLNTFSNSPMIFGTNNTERMRIDSSGNLSVGTTDTNNALLQLNKFTGGTKILATGDDGSGNSEGLVVTYSGVATANYRSLLGMDAYAGVVKLRNSANTQTVNITAGGNSYFTGGNLLVGTTSVTGKITSFITGVSGYSISAGTDNAGAALYSGAANTTIVYTVFGNGNVVNTNNSYGAISDIKNKENIVDATPKLDKLMQVKIRNYNLKGEYEQHKQIGVIAQELEQIFPSMIEETPDRDAEGKDLGTTTKSVKYSVFVPMLIKAIQEQQAIINDLKARIETLESK